jgi:membrane protein DedA with SNARE-associated domain
MVHELITTITEFLMHLVKDLGYIGIFIATLVESTFVPIPAEVTMIPAGINAGKGEMNYWLILLSSTAGVIVGSLVNYYIGFKYGRGFIVRYGKYFFLKPSFLDKVEVFFQKHGTFAAFSGRLIPGVRHYIAFPAGMAKMNMKTFIICTATGGLIWMWILLHLGYRAGQKAGADGTVSLENLEQVIVILILLIGALYGARMLIIRRQNAASATAAKPLPPAE